MDSLRIDKWLWAARFYKTRSLACDEVTKHRVQINGQDVKPAREVKVGDTLTVRQGNITKTVQVKGISAARGPAPVAQLLYEETAESMALRANTTARASVIWFNDSASYPSFRRKSRIAVRSASAFFASDHSGNLARSACCCSRK